MSYRLFSTSIYVWIFFFGGGGILCEVEIFLEIFLGVVVFTREILQGAVFRGRNSPLVWGSFLKKIFTRNFYQGWKCLEQGILRGKNFPRRILYDGKFFTVGGGVFLGIIWTRSEIKFEKKTSILTESREQNQNLQRTDIIPYQGGLT